MVSKQLKYDRCKCGNRKVDKSKKCQKCHWTKGSLRVSEQMQDERQRDKKIMTMGEIIRRRLKEDKKQTKNE